MLKSFWPTGKAMVLVVPVRTIIVRPIVTNIWSIYIRSVIILPMPIIVTLLSKKLITCTPMVTILMIINILRVSLVLLIVTPTHLLSVVLSVGKIVSRSIGLVT